MSGGGGGGRRGAPEEEHENHERWLVSYADMVTVMMALFIVLFAISQVDAEKFEALAHGLADGFGNNSGIPVSGGSGILTHTGDSVLPNEMIPIAAPAPVDLTGDGSRDDEDGKARSAAIMAQALEEYERLKGVEEQMKQELEARGLQDQVQFRINERGLVAAIISDGIVFDSAKADLKPAGRQVIDSLAPVLQTIPDAIVTEGHANHLLLQNTAHYPSNLHLSSARASSVMLYLWEVSGMDHGRTSTSGFGSTRPLYPVDDPKAIEGNRRVDVVVLSPKAAAVRGMLPQLAQARDGQTTPVEQPVDNANAVTGAAVIDS